MDQERVLDRWTKRRLVPVTDDIIKEVPQRITELTGLSVEEAIWEPRGAEDCHADLLVRTREKTFLVEFKDKAAAEAVGSGIRVLKRCLVHDDRAQIPLLVVPYMWDVGRRLCEESGIAWLDLSGNASIHAPGLHVNVEGNPNRFNRRGRPKNLFAAKASRIARVLLLAPSQYRRQQDLVEETGLSKGYVSKVVSRLEEASLVERDGVGKVWVPDPDLLLDAWSEAYDFTSHEIHPGHIASRAPAQTVARIVEVLDSAQQQYAFTGLAGAWRYTQHAAYRLITLYVSDLPHSSVFEDLGFRETGSSGANTWFVLPDDSGVFDGKKKLEDVWCVSPVQVYLDLLDHPERSREAAEYLRKECLSWNGG